MSVDEVVNWVYTDEKMPILMRRYMVAVHYPNFEAISVALWEDGKFFLGGIEIEVYAWAELPDTPPYEVEDNG